MKAMESEEKVAIYQDVEKRIRALIEGERDAIAVMAAVSCELRQSFSYFNWVGFYRVTQPGVLKIGPFQGGHACLTIPFEQGVCGTCAREKSPQIVADVTQVPYHIACSNSTRSEIVVPVFDSHGELCAVLDVDSDLPGAFGTTEQKGLERIVEVFAHI
jgi:GAF domain-containing protein